jgi:hypothetical protein
MRHPYNTTPQDRRYRRRAHCQSRRHARATQCMELPPRRHQCSRIPRRRPHQRVRWTRDRTRRRRPLRKARCRDYSQRRVSSRMTPPGTPLRCLQTRPRRSFLRDRSRRLSHPPLRSSSRPRRCRARRRRTMAWQPPARCCSAPRHTARAPRPDPRTSSLRDTPRPARRRHRAHRTRQRRRRRARGARCPPAPKCRRHRARPRPSRTDTTTRPPPRRGGALPPRHCM